MPKYVALISGGTGFVGSRIVEHLLADGAEVRILSSGTADRAHLRSTSDRVHWWSVSNADLDIAVRDANCFFHFAVAYDRPNVSDEVLQAVNVDLPQRVISRLRGQGRLATCVLGDTFFRKFPAEATRQPRYTRSKTQLAERLLSDKSRFDPDVRVALLQIEQVYGPGDSFTKVLPLLTRQMLDNVPRLALTHGQQRRDFVHVEDVATAAMTLRSAEWQGVQRVECGTGVSTPVGEVLNRLRVLTGSRSVLGFGDMPPDQAIDDSYADLAWLSSCGWRPRVPLQEGLAELVQDVEVRTSAPDA